MADNSAIEWTDATWNPIRARNIKTGKLGWHCEHATTGCEFCYAEGFNKRLGTGLAFKPGHRADIEIFLDENMLTQPLRWKKPRMIFVCSMTDLFADFVPDEFIDKMFAVMALAPQHTFQVLTKRAARMQSYVCSLQQRWDTLEPAETEADRRAHAIANSISEWPLPNLWLGVSTERQEEANERIPLLLQTPATIRFVSAEPLLGPIDLSGILARFQDDLIAKRQCAVPLGRQLIDWVIVGGESGPKARPMHPDWARDLRDQCSTAGVAFFFKQWGEWGDAEDWPSEMQEHLELVNKADGNNVRVGKKAAGRKLDGRLHNAMPVRRA